MSAIEWLGCTTFRVRAGGRTLWFDTFVDRIEGARDVGVRSADVREADFVFVTHTHLDHVLGADVIARATGAPVIGSHETIRVMRECGVPEEQCWAVSGGETVRCGDGLFVRVLPALHSCLWPAEVLAPYFAERRAATRAAVEQLHALTPEVQRYLACHAGEASRADGGTLSYLLQAPDGSVLFSSSAGYWSVFMRDLRPDLAMLAVAGRPNLDGEPFDGGMERFIADEVALLAPRAVALCHHDEWMPPIPPVDIEPILAEVARREPAVRIERLELGRTIEL
jgi:L-ascorbate metabolism protein UlaG (beta-lactamase superfamily)